MNIVFRVFVLLLLFFSTGEIVAQNNSRARIVFSAVEHDFGRFKEEEGVKACVFEFVNKGNSPLIILDVQTSCGCTSPEWTKKPIPPGAGGNVKVNYDPANFAGPFNKPVVIITNGTPYQVELRVKGEVISRPRTVNERYPSKMDDLLLRSNHLSFSTIKINQVKTDTLPVMNNSSRPLSVDFRDVPSHLSIRMEPGTLKPKGEGNIIVTFNATKVGAFGYSMDKIYMRINGSRSENNMIGITATIEEDFSKLTPEEIRNAPVVSFDELNHDFGNIKSGEKVTHIFTIKNDGINNLIIRDINNYCTCTVVTPSTTIIKQNSSAKLKVVFDSSGRQGRQNKSISVITNDPSNPTVILRVSAYIRPK